MLLQCGFPVRPRLELVLPAATEVLSIVWRDNLNRTVALDTKQLELPPLASLTESSAVGAEQCNQGCDWQYHVSAANDYSRMDFSSCIHHKAAAKGLQSPKQSLLVCSHLVQVKVLAVDGAQTEADISVGSISMALLNMKVTYSYFVRRAVLTAVESHSIPVVYQAPQKPAAAQGMLVLSHTVPLRTQQVRPDIGSGPWLAILLPFLCRDSM